MQWGKLQPRPTAPHHLSTSYSLAIYSNESISCLKKRKIRKISREPDGTDQVEKFNFQAPAYAELRLKLENKLHPQLSHQVAIIAIKTNKTQAALQKMWPRMNVRCCRAAEPQLWIGFAKKKEENK